MRRALCHPPRAARVLLYGPLRVGLGCPLRRHNTHNGRHEDCSRRWPLVRLIADPRACSPRASPIPFAWCGLVGVCTSRVHVHVHVCACCLLVSTGDLGARPAAALPGRAGGGQEGSAGGPPRGGLTDGSRRDDTQGRGQGAQGVQGARPIGIVEREARTGTDEQHQPLGRLGGSLGGGLVAGWAVVAGRDVVV